MRTLEMASNLRAMASNLAAMASNLVAIWRSGNNTLTIPWILSREGQDSAHRMEVATDLTRYVQRRLREEKDGSFWTV